MYFESDAYPELVYSLAAQQVRERRQLALRRRARRERWAGRATRVRALLAAPRA